MKSTSETAVMSGQEAEQIERANASGLQPVVFVHGLWLLQNSWERWASFFEESGYVAVASGWPDDPATVAEGNAHPEAFANKTIGQIADHQEAIILALKRKPALVTFRLTSANRGSCHKSALTLPTRLNIEQG